MDFNVTKNKQFTDMVSDSKLRLTFKKSSRGFPGGAVVENLPANAGDTGSSPGLGRSHMPRSNWAREPHLLSLRVWSLCSATREAAIVRGLRTAMRSGPHLPQLEKALAQKLRPNTAINKEKKRNHPLSKREPSYTVGGNVSWCTHYGKQYGGSSKK